MGKTAVNTLISSIKKRIDYDITDTSLDALLLDMLNDGVINMRQWMLDADLVGDISKSSSFVVLSGDESADITQSIVVGDSTTFTGVTGDTIDVQISGIDYADIDISAATTIAAVVTAINTSVGSTVASTDDDGNLKITPTTGTGNVIVTDGTSTTTTCIARLISLARNRSDTGISDFDEVLRLREKDNDKVLRLVGFEDLVDSEPDESVGSASTPDIAALWSDGSTFFFRPTLSKSLRIYIDYFPQHTALVAGATLPFKTKYDPVLKQYCRLEFLKWQLRGNPNLNNILIVEKGVLDDLVKQFITKATKNIGKNRGQRSRRSGSGAVGPRRVIST